MHLVVCLKQIIDPEIPARDFRVDGEKREAVRGSANLVTNVFCENALATALAFREKFGGKITALAFGPASVEDTLRKALALKVDAAAHVVEETAGQTRDAAIVARALSAAIGKLEAVDTVLVGRESGDWGFGQTGGLVAEMLGWPCLAFVDELSVEGKSLRLRRQTESGWEVYESAQPLVVTITNSDHNQPRLPKTRDVMLAHRQPITKWTASQLQVSADRAWSPVADLRIPERETLCEFIGGDSLDERLDSLAAKIRGVLRGI